MVGLACNGAISTTLAVHLVGVLHDKGYGPGEIAVVIALAGPSQVAVRFLLAFGDGRFNSRAWSKIALWLQVVALLVLWLCNEQSGLGWLVFVFSLCNGIVAGLTLVVGALITSEMFGAANYGAYGAVQGVLKLASTLARSVGPVLFAYVVASFDGSGIANLALVGVSMASLVVCSTASGRVGAARQVGSGADDSKTRSRYDTSARG
ncbi:MAG: hypothetical protein CBARDMAM_5148 [uncultured Caballeronia sp.]|nr:MAG: hypothetical protein CBARDMAM_5148 [uncultured Caballeronia sp.]